MPPDSYGTYTLWDSTSSGTTSKLKFKYDTHKKIIFEAPKPIEPDKEPEPQNLEHVNLEKLCANVIVHRNIAWLSVGFLMTFYEKWRSATNQAEFLRRRGIASAERIQVLQAATEELVKIIDKVNATPALQSRVAEPKPERFPWT